VCAIKAWAISSAYINFRAQNPIGLKYSLPRKIHLGDSILANKTFLFVDQSSPVFFPGTREESLSIIFLSDFGYLESFRRYSRSKSKAVKNRDEFWTFFWPSQILGGRPSKSYTHVMTHVPWHVVRKMLCGDTPTNPEVIVANTLNFKPNFKFSRLKLGGGPLSHFGCALSRLGQSLARVKFLVRSTPYGLKYSMPKKCILVSPNSHGIPSRWWTKVHRTFFIKRRRN